MGKLTKDYMDAARDVATKKEELASIVNRDMLTRGARKFVADDASNRIFAAKHMDYEKYIYHSEKICVVMRLIIESVPAAREKLYKYLGEIGMRPDERMFEEMVKEYDIDPDMFKAEPEPVAILEDDEKEEEDDDQKEEDLSKGISKPTGDEVIDRGDKRQYKRKQERLRYALQHGKIDKAEYERELGLLKSLYGVK